MDLRADKKSLKKLLAIDEQQFRIPPYQRPYSWTADQVDDLWEDLVSSDGHFLGSIVMSTEDESRPQIIDGQQRLTTLMLLLSAIRDQYHARAMLKQVQRIDRRFIADDLAEGDSQFKFRTGSANWPVFRDFVLRGPTDPARRDDVSVLDRITRARNRQLIDNLNRLRALLGGHLKSLPEPDQDTWLEWFDKMIMERVELVVIEVPELSDAFLLFETLNDRGMQLSGADLLKSHLLGQIADRESAEDVESASQQWDDMLESLGASVDVSRFLRHYLLGTIPRVQQDEVFDYFKRRVKADGARFVLDEISRSARAYGEFEDPTRVTHPATRRVLTDLKTLRAVTCYIALLPARRYLSENDFVEFARLAEVLTYRYSSVVGLGTRELERKYHDAAKMLIESEGRRLSDARRVLVAAMPDSEQFRVAFERLEMGRQYLLRYTLRKIEESLAETKEKELKTSDLVHIEHIMPQTLSDEWRAALGPDVERHAEALNKWGNLTLFYAGLNIPASNKTFAEKRPYYEKSDVELTRRLTRFETWGVPQIEARQRELAGVADALWSVKPEPGSETVVEALPRFAAELGELWPAVEQFCVETSADEIAQLAARLPSHLAEHKVHSGQAARLAARIQDLVAEWASLDAAQRSVVRAATAYFLEADDAIPDHAAAGLGDDEAVVDAAFVALGRAERT